MYPNTNLVAEYKTTDPRISSTDISQKTAFHFYRRCNIERDFVRNIGAGGAGVPPGPSNHPRPHNSFKRRRVYFSNNRPQYLILLRQFSIILNERENQIGHLLKCDVMLLLWTDLLGRGFYNGDCACWMIIDRSPIRIDRGANPGQTRPPWRGFVARYNNPTLTILICHCGNCANDLLGLFRTRNVFDIKRRIMLFIPDIG